MDICFVCLKWKDQVVALEFSFVMLFNFHLGIEILFTSMLASFNEYIYFFLQICREIVAYCRGWVC